MKILIIGIVASGKTTLAKQLSKKLNIQYYEIDSIVHIHSLIHSLYQWIISLETEWFDEQNNDSSKKKNDEIHQSNQSKSKSKKL